MFYSPFAVSWKLHGEIVHKSVSDVGTRYLPEEHSPSPSLHTLFVCAHVCHCVCMCVFWRLFRPLSSPPEMCGWLMKRWRTWLPPRKRSVPSGCSPPVPITTTARHLHTLPSQWHTRPRPEKTSLHCIFFNATISGEKVFAHFCVGYLLGLSSCLDWNLGQMWFGLRINISEMHYFYVSASKNKTKTKHQHKTIMCVCMCLCILIFILLWGQNKLRSPGVISYIMGKIWFIYGKMLLNIKLHFGWQ